jgi:ubiquinone biosynthesis protein
MEGVGIKLDPDFDIFAVSRPYVRRFVWHLALPSAWGPPLIKGGNNWVELMQNIPRVGSQVLRSIEREGLEVKIQHRGLDEALGRLDQTANRLSLSILLAALIVGLALLIPTFNLAEQWGLATIVVITGFAGVSLLGLWLVFSIWRSGR